MAVRSYLAGMRCTFYVDGDLFDPWEEELLPGPPRVGRIISRFGYTWAVARVTFNDVLGSSTQEAAISLVRASDTGTWGERPT
jgi:hypothetical protein